MQRLHLVHKYIVETTTRISTKIIMLVRAFIFIPGLTVDNVNLKKKQFSFMKLFPGLIVSLASMY